MVLEQLDGFAAIARLGHDVQLGPQAHQMGGEAFAQQRLVVGNQGRRGIHGLSSGIVISARTPCGSTLCKANAAVLP